MNEATILNETAAKIPLSEKTPENAPVGLIMNEKRLAEYLGTSTYFITLLRKNYGLKYLMLEGLHSIYYYLPMVDEFFRKHSKTFSGSDAGAEDDHEESEVPEVKLPEPLDVSMISEPKSQRVKHYRPMKAI